MAIRINAIPVHCVQNKYLAFATFKSDSQVDFKTILYKEHLRVNGNMKVPANKNKIFYCKHNFPNNS